MGDEHVSAGFDPADTELAPPIVFATKKDGTLRSSVEYHKHNAVKFGDVYRILRMDKCIVSLAYVTVFATINVTCGY